ncbi:MAG: hypothetical protein M1831_003384 [Alyxoria varia]|nr:MAG: hypothetical protein M1831_003384 [Alyxoria varia]
MGQDLMRGAYYIGIGWPLTVIMLATVSLRLYTRTFLTRSLGADDATIIFPAILSFVGQIGDTLGTVNGEGRHEWLLSLNQLEHAYKWLYINWMIVFVSFFFLRSSIMLFTLRLLPFTKNVQRRVIYVCLAFNFAITMVVAVSYGLKCRPFSASWKQVGGHQVPGAKCISSDVIAATQQVNGALVPAFLLWDLQIKRSTKLVLNVIFALGMITAGLSIGRAATLKPEFWDHDALYRIMPSLTLSLVEEKMGIIFASCPALRQCVVYIQRSHTLLPSAHRCEPNADFATMRRRVTVRDIMWWQDPKKKSLVSASMSTSQRPMLEGQTISEATAQQDSEERARLDPFRKLRRGIKAVLSLPSRGSVDRSTDTAKATKASSNMEKARGWPGSDPSSETSRIAKSYHKWGLSSSDSTTTPTSSSADRSTSRHDSKDTNSSPPPLPTYFRMTSGESQKGQHMDFARSPRSPTSPAEPISPGTSTPPPPVVGVKRIVSTEEIKADPAKPSRPKEALHRSHHVKSAVVQDRMPSDASAPPPEQVAGLQRRLSGDQHRGSRTGTPRPTGNLERTHNRVSEQSVERDTSAAVNYRKDGEVVGVKRELEREEAEGVKARPLGPDEPETYRTSYKHEDHQPVSKGEAISRKGANLLKSNEEEAGEQAQGAGSEARASQVLSLRDALKHDDNEDEPSSRNDKEVALTKKYGNQA